MGRIINRLGQAKERIGNRTQGQGNTIINQSNKQNQQTWLQILRSLENNQEIKHKKTRARKRMEMQPKGIKSTFDKIIIENPKSR